MGSVSVHLPLSFWPYILKLSQLGINEVLETSMTGSNAVVGPPILMKLGLITSSYVATVYPVDDYSD